MNNKDLNIHWSFWVISIIALPWHLPGIVGLLTQMNTEMLANIPESHRAIIENRPSWASGACTLAIFSGILGCFALLFNLRSV